VAAVARRRIWRTLTTAPWPFPSPSRRIGSELCSPRGRWAARGANNTQFENSLTEYYKFFIFFYLDGSISFFRSDKERIQYFGIP